MTAPEPIWLRKDVLVALHGESLAEHGGLPGLRSESLLESALARPRNLFEYEQAAGPRLAATYAVGITRNHPFNDGNKRAALIALITFMRLNRIAYRITNGEAYAAIMALSAGELGDDAFTQWLEAHCPSS